MSNVSDSFSQGSVKGTNNALAVLDGILGALAKGGLGREGKLKRNSELIIQKNSALTTLTSVQVLSIFSSAQPFGRKLIGESAVPALYFCSAILEVLYDCIPKVQTISLDDQLSFFFHVRQWPEDKFVKYAKYCTTYPMARYLHNDLPERPSGFKDHPLLFDGPIRKILKNRLISVNKVNLRLWNSYLQGVKRACAVVPPSYVSQSMISHLLKMKAEDSAPEEFIEDFQDYATRMIPNSWLNSRSSRYIGEEGIKKLSRKKYLEGLGKDFHPSKPTIIEASPSASVEAKRSDGGARDYIRRLTVHDSSYGMNSRGVLGYRNGEPSEESEFKNESIQSLRNVIIEDQLIRMEELSPGKIVNLTGVPVPDFDEALRLAESSLAPGDCHTDRSHPQPEEVRFHESGCPYLQNPLPDSSSDPSLCIKNPEPTAQSRVSAVLEPLKVRLITKGQSYPQWVARFWQKDLWSYLQRYRQFCLTGRPLEVSDLHWVLLQEESILHQINKKRDYLRQKKVQTIFNLKNLKSKNKMDDDESTSSDLPDVIYGCDEDIKNLDTLFKEPKWVSGDYSGATDGVNISMTKSVHEVFLSVAKEERGFSKNLREVLRSVLYEQLIFYPKFENPGFPQKEFESLLKTLVQEGINQTNGQLMGSVLSFPILCIINLLCYWMTFEEYFKVKVRPQDLPVLVNGDDILFRTDEDFYQLWLSNIRKAGFTLSLGKNYVHQHVLMINSTMYYYTRREVRDPILGSSSSKLVHNFEFVPFLNVGLLTGQSKLTGRQADRLLPLKDIFEVVVEGAFNKERITKRFIHYHLERILEETDGGRYNLFIPTELGGLGLRPPENFKITSFQQRFASYVKQMRYKQIAEGKIPSGIGVGLIMNTETKRPSKKHFYKLVEMDTYGPLLQPTRLPLDTLVRFDPLQESFDPEPELRVRLPRNLRPIKNNSIEKMSYKKIMRGLPPLLEIYDVEDTLPTPRSREDEEEILLLREHIRQLDEEAKMLDLV